MILNNKIIIAIDGVSASGKGSIAKLLAKEFNLAYLDTGLLYRYVGYKVITNNIDHNDLKAITIIAKQLNLSEIEQKDLHNEEVAKVASIVAKITTVREALLDLQRNFATNTQDHNGAILDGRDIGTVICPNADIKFFITADLKQRAKRRYIQLQNNGQNVDLAKITESISSRDLRDKEINDKAYNNKSYIIIDNTNLNLEQSYDMVKQYVINYLNKK
ncbi:(d)CMP kinase [Rickettsiales bacterium LUAb2]